MVDSLAASEARDAFAASRGVVAAALRHSSLMARPGYQFIVPGRAANHLGHPLDEGELVIGGEVIGRDHVGVHVGTAVRVHARIRV